MTLYVTEHMGDRLDRTPVNRQINGAGAHTINSSVSGVVGPFPQAGTKYIRVTADVGTFLNLSNASTGITLPSTSITTANGGCHARSGRLCAAKCGVTGKKLAKAASPLLFL